MSYKKEKELTNKLIINRSKYTLFALRPSSFQKDDMIMTMLGRFAKSESILIPLGARGTGYFCNKKKLEKFYKDYSSTLAIEKNIKGHIQYYNRFAGKLIKVSKEALKISSDSRELKLYFEKWTKTLADYSLFFLMPFMIENIFEPRLRISLQKNFGSNSDRILDIIGYPTIIFGYQQYHIDLVEMGEKINYNQLISKYLWIPEYSFQEELLNKKLIDNELKNIRKK